MIPSPTLQFVLALVVLVFAVGAKVLPREWKLKSKIKVLLAVLAFLAAASAVYESRVTRTTGKLSSRVAFGCDTCITFEAGGNTISWKPGMGQKWNTKDYMPLPRQLIGFDGRPLFDIAVRVEGRRLWVSAQFRDESGRVVMEVEDNHWIVNERQAYQFNYDDRALEVIDEFGVPRLFLEIREPCVLRVLGLFPVRDGVAIVDDQGFRVLPLEQSRSYFEQVGDSLAGLRRQFRYPQVQFLGVRDVR